MILMLIKGENERKYEVLFSLLYVMTLMLTERGAVVIIIICNDADADYRRE